MKELIVQTFSKSNSWISVIATFITSIFGMQWGLFAAYLLLNIIDYITGIIKAKKNKKENSKEGVKGILKKVCYWLIIMTTFIISYILIEICNKFNINIEFVMFFGWFTLGCLAINEARSIVENLIELEINVPTFLIKGLESANKEIENIMDDKITKNETKKTSINK